MTMSDDVLAMTFSSDSSPAVAIDGMLIDSQTTAAVLNEAKKRQKVKELTLRSVTIDETVAKAAEDLFSDDQRRWTKIELIHCTGFSARFIEASICRTEQLAFTGSVPIAHNPRYSLDAKCMEAMANALKNCDSLKTLSLKGSRLERAGLEVFRDGLERSTTLQTLQLSHCAMETPDISFLADALQGNQHLTALSLAHCKIGAKPFSDESVLAFCNLLESIVRHPALQVLNILGMYCTERSIQVLSNLLRAPRSRLWHLGMKNNIRHPEEKLGVTSLFQALEVNTSLTYLQVSGNNVDDADAEQLAQIISTSNKTLRALTLTANKIGDDGLRSFARRLTKIKGLRYLDVQRNNFSSEGKAEIITALKDNMELERLDMDGTWDETKAFYLILNKGGRRLLQSGNRTPLGLWPVVLERANRLPFSRNLPFAHLDVLYALLRGPALFQPRLKRDRAESQDETDANEPTQKRLRRT